MVVSSALLAVSRWQHRRDREDPRRPRPGADDPASSRPPRPQLERRLAAAGRSDATTTTGPSSSTTNRRVRPWTRPTPPPRRPALGHPSGAPPAVSAILRGQPVRRHPASRSWPATPASCARLRRVAVGGDLGSAPTPSRRRRPPLDETAIGLLVGARSAGRPRRRLTVGDPTCSWQVGAVQTRSMVAWPCPGADVAADPQLRANGPQAADRVLARRVRAPFGGVRRSAARVTLAKLKPVDADGGRRWCHRQRRPPAPTCTWRADRDGPASGRSTRRPGPDGIHHRSAPTEQRPLVINVDGDGGGCSSTGRSRWTPPGPPRVERRRRRPSSWRSGSPALIPPDHRWRRRRRAR